ncbi:hypothetical protein ACU686_39990 [Yinghuangia aomiensis]
MLVRTLLDGPLADDPDSRNAALARRRLPGTRQTGRRAARLKPRSHRLPAPAADLARLAWAVERGDRETVRTLSDRIAARFGTGAAAADP